MISFITLNYGQQEMTIKSINNNIKIILEQKIDFKYVVIDNGSINAQEDLQKFCSESEHILYSNRKENFGVCEALNYAIEQIYNVSDFIIRIDNDVFLKSSFSINKYCNYLIDHEVAISGPLVRGRNGEFQSGQIKISKYGNNSKRFNPTNPKISDTILGCFMVFNTGQLSNENCRFDENLKFGSEELEICLRAKKSNKRIIYYPKFEVVHMDGTTTNSKKYMWSFTTYLLIRNNEVVLRQHTDYLTSLLRIINYTIYHLIRAILNQDSMQIRAYLSGVVKNKITKSEWKKLNNYFRKTQLFQH